MMELSNELLGYSSIVRRLRSWTDEDVVGRIFLNLLNGNLVPPEIPKL